MHVLRIIPYLKRVLFFFLTGNHNSFSKTQSESTAPVTRDSNVTLMVEQSINSEV